MNVHIVPMEEIRSVAASIHHYFHQLGTPEALTGIMADMVINHVTDNADVGEVEPADLIVMFEEEGVPVPHPETLGAMLSAIVGFLNGFIDRYCNFDLTGAIKVSARIAKYNLLIEVRTVEKETITVCPAELRIKVRKELLEMKDSNRRFINRSDLRVLARLADSVFVELGDLELMELSGNAALEDVHERTAELYNVWERSKARFEK